VHALPIEALLAQGTPTAEWRDADGRERIASVRTLARSGWHVAVVGDLAAGFAPILATLGRIFLLDTALVVLAAWLAWRLTVRLVRPVQALWDGAHRIAEGDLEVEVPESESGDEIAELTRTFNAMARKLRDDQREIEAAQQQLRQQNQALQAANEVLAQLSITDGLTRLHNHRFFQEHLTRELKRVQRTGEPLAMLLIDIDDFKALNDRWGHAVGDAVLARIGTVMNANVRESDLLARYGGEEFVVLAPIDIEGAVVLAEKLRMAVERELLALEEADGPLHVTVSVGVARFRGDRKAFFRDADRALYAAKREGKNCVVVEAETLP
jgi:diguanylate cyclase (GGDEF)-like protein